MTHRLNSESFIDAKTSKAIEEALDEHLGLFEHTQPIQILWKTDSWLKWLREAKSSTLYLKPSFSAPGYNLRFRSDANPIEIDRITFLYAIECWGHKGTGIGALVDAAYAVADHFYPIFGHAHTANLQATELAKKYGYFLPSKTYAEFLNTHEFFELSSVSVNMGGLQSPRQWLGLPVHLSGLARKTARLKVSKCRENTPPLPQYSVIEAALIHHLSAFDWEEPFRIEFRNIDPYRINIDSPVIIPVFQTTAHHPREFPDEGVKVVHSAWIEFWVYTDKGAGPQLSLRLLDAIKKHFMPPNEGGKLLLEENSFLRCLREEPDIYEPRSWSQRDDLLFAKMIISFVAIL